MNIKLKRFLITVIATPVAALALWVVAVPMLGTELVAAEVTVGAGSVVFSSVVAGLGAWVLLAVLERLTAKASLVWTIVAVAVLVLSLPLGPLGAEGAGAVAALAGMHVVVAAVLIPGLRRHRADGAGRE